MHGIVNSVNIREVTQKIIFEFRLKILNFSKCVLAPLTFSLLYV